MPRKGLFEDESQRRAADRVAYILIANVFAPPVLLLTGLLHTSVAVILMLLYVISTLTLILLAGMASNRTPGESPGEAGFRTAGTGCILLFTYGLMLILGVMLGVGALRILEDVV